jgi:LAO/AO transport system kinase
VLTCSALEGSGIDEVWSALGEFMTAARASGSLSQRRAEQALDWMWSEVSETLLDRLRSDEHVHSALSEVEAAVMAGTVSPSAAARSLLARFQVP